MFNIVYHLFGILTCYSGNKSHAESWKYASFIDNHVKILSLGWHDVSIMPMNVPVLTKVEISSLFTAHFIHLKFKGVTFDKLINFHDWNTVKKSSRVDGIIFTIFDVSARLPSSHKTLVLNIVDHQTAVVNILGKSTSKKNIVTVVFTCGYSFCNISSN